MARICCLRDDLLPLRFSTGIAESTKSALDVNNKLLVEIAYLQVEMIHMQALANQAASWRMRHDLKSAASTDKFLGEAGGKS